MWKEQIGTNVFCQIYECECKMNKEEGFFREESRPGNSSESQQAYLTTCIEIFCSCKSE
jgi:hypothetical protein